MSIPKKGQLFQFAFPAIDEDGSLVHNITASDFNSGATKKFYGVNHGTSAAATSGSISKTASLITSGLLRITLKTTENNYDQMTAKISKTGLRSALIQWNNADYDDSDLYSLISDLLSDVKSAVTVGQSLSSDAHSAAAQANSRVLLIQSGLSDIGSTLAVFSSIQSDLYSAMSDLASDLQSRIPKRVATDSQLSDVHSDLRSLLTLVQSLASDAHSAAAQGSSRALLNASAISDVYSRLAGLSDQLSDAHSDLASKIGAVSVTIGASDISDIASALVDALPITQQISQIQEVLSDFYSDFQSKVPKRVATDSALSDVQSNLLSYLLGMSGMLSDTHSAATAGASRALLNQSRISDLQSLLSDVNSDLASKIAGIAVSLSPSDISDIASAVVAAIPFGSQISDIYSMLSDFYSDFQSKVPKRVATDSQLSNTHSDLLSLLNAVGDIASDAHSAAAAGSSRMLLGLSSISDLQSALSDFASNFDSRVPKLVANNSQVSQLVSDVLSQLAAQSDMISNAYSAAVQGSSRTLLIQSNLSDVQSQLNAGVTIGLSSLSDIESLITAGRRTAMPESYRSGEAAPTMEQAFWELLQQMGSREIVGDEVRLKNTAGATVKTYTLTPDGTNPTGISTDP